MAGSFGNTAIALLLQRVWETEPNFEGYPDPIEGDVVAKDAPPFIGRLNGLKRSLEQEQSGENYDLLKIYSGCAGLLKGMAKLEFDVCVMTLEDRDELFIARNGMIMRRKKPPKQDNEKVAESP